MKAVVMTGFGGPEVLKVEETKDPEIEPGQVLIKVEASSVNPVDYKMRDGRAAFLVPEFPAVLHPDCAGTVIAVGENVSQFAVGDEVYSFATGLAGKPGATAEFMAADADKVAKKPSNLSFADAAAVPLVAVTAWYNLVTFAQVRPGKSVLVMGGTGGVGHIAVQLAKSRGAFVGAVSGGAEKCQLAKDLGADVVIDYKTTPPDDYAQYAPDGRGFDFVFNTPGTPSVDAAVAACRFEGTIIDILGEFPTTFGFQPKWLTFKSTFAGHDIVSGASQSEIGMILSAIATLIEVGAIRPLIDKQRFGFREAAAAHHYAEHGAITGKVVMVQDL